MNKFSFSWLMSNDERSFDEKSRCGYWVRELNTEWKVKCICDTKKLRNPAFIEVHRKSLAGERIVSGNLEMREELNCHLKKKFVCLIEDGCQFARCDFQYSRDAVKLPKQFSVTGTITISARTEDSFDLSELIHLTNSDYPSLRQLSHDMEKLLLKKPFLADVSLKCGTVTFAAHKSFLSARSPVFEAMFSCPMMEASGNEVVIEDIEVAVLLAMLKYIYTGRIEDLTPSLATNLLFTANKYQIAGLESACTKHLMSTMSMKNVANVLEVGDLVSADLKNFAIDFLCNKCTDYPALEKRKDWIDLKNKKPFLALEVFSAVVKLQEQKLKLRN